jgi:hypothetical protein
MRSAWLSVRSEPVVRWVSCWRPSNGTTVVGPDRRPAGTPQTVTRSTVTRRHPTSTGHRDRPSHLDPGTPRAGVPPSHSLATDQSGLPACGGGRAAGRVPSAPAGKREGLRGVAAHPPRFLRWPLAPGRYPARGWLSSRPTGARRSRPMGRSRRRERRARPSWRGTRRTHG